jgi:hypothetical protein
MMAPELIITLFACLSLVVDIVTPKRGRVTALFCPCGIALAIISAGGFTLVTRR